MGLPATNAGQEASQQIAGNVTYQPEAIREKNDLTQALTEGLHSYRNGLDRVAGYSGQASPSAVNAYRNAWTQNFDPNVFRGELAARRDPTGAEVKEFVGTLPPVEAKSLQAKRAALKTLQQGQMPQ